MKFYTVKEIAHILQVHPATIRRYIKEGKISAFQHGFSGRYRISDAEFWRFIEECQKENDK